MPKFSANISMMFTEVPFLDRFAAAKGAGFDGIEFQFPYDLDLAELKEVAEVTGLPILVINHFVGDLQQGGPGIAALPSAEDEFKRATELTYKYAEVLRPLTVNVLAGSPPVEDFGRERCLDVLAANLRTVADTMVGIGVRVTTEAINPIDRPTFLLSSTDQALDVIGRAGYPDIANLGIQYDLYHAQIMEGDLVRTMEANLPHIGHIQFADTPGRHEPGTGEINFPYVFAALDRMGWTGFVGAEYVPSGATGASLEWLKSEAK